MISDFEEYREISGKFELSAPEWIHFKSTAIAGGYDFEENTDAAIIVGGLESLAYTLGEVDLSQFHGGNYVTEAENYYADEAIDAEIEELNDVAAGPSVSYHGSSDDNENTLTNFNIDHAIKGKCDFNINDALLIIK